MANWSRQVEELAISGTADQRFFPFHLEADAHTLYATYH